MYNVNERWKDRLHKKNVNRGEWQYQGGNSFRAGVHHKRLIQMLPDYQCKILDVGSGITYGLEAMIYKKRIEYHDIIDCVDRSLGSGHKPTFIRNHFQCDIEKEMDLNEKYDVVICFEVMEHVDHTDVLLQNCLRHLKKNGLFFISIPNLSSIYARVELLLGLQPHVLEVSNEYANFGGGIFGKLNSPSGNPVHHIRGITYRACKEMLMFNGFRILEKWGTTHGKHEYLVRHLPGIAPEVWFVCTRTDSRIEKVRISHIKNKT